jgi:hypothetical protein
VEWTAKLALTLLIVPVSGALLLASCACQAAPAHFEARGIAFDYPVTWEELFDPFTVAYFGEPGTDTAVKVFDRALPMGITLEIYHDDLVYILKEGEPISSGSIPIAGHFGYESVFMTVVDGREIQMRLISFAVEGLVTDIYLSAATAWFDETQQDFDVIIGSFRVY